MSTPPSNETISIINSTDTMSINNPNDTMDLTDTMTDAPTLVDVVVDVVVDVAVVPDDSNVLSDVDNTTFSPAFIIFICVTAFFLLVVLLCFLLNVFGSKSSAKEESVPKAVDENDDDNKGDIESPADNEKSNVEEVPDNNATKSMDSADGSKIVQAKSTEKSVGGPEENTTQAIDQNQSAVSVSQSKSEDNEIKDLKSESKESVKSEINDDLKSKSKDSSDQNVGKEIEQPEESVAATADVSVEVPMERVDTFEVKNEALCGSLDCC